MAQGKKHEPTPESRAVVRELAAFGIPQDRIAERLEISSKTLREHYTDEIDNAKDEANLTVYKTAFSLATSGECPAMTMFWCKTRMGWKETNVVEHSGGIQHYDLTKLTDEQFRAVEAALAAVTVTPSDPS
jgi:hypothetical protein